MENGAELEIYIQRYETFRHLDKMRYHAQNITILLGTLFAGYAAQLKGDYHPAAGLVTGLIIISFGFTMRRITKGIVSNSIVLKEIGDKIGDTRLPIASAGWNTANFWTSSLTLLIGTALAAYSTLDWVEVV